MVNLPHVLHVAQQVRYALLQRLQVLRRQVLFVHAPVHLQGPHSSDHHHRVRYQPGHAALDIQEFLRAQVRAEARLSHGIVPHAHGHPRRHHGIASVGDVGEGPAVHEGRGALQGLHQVGLQGVLQQRRHGAGGLQIPGGHGPIVIGVSHHDPAQPLLQVGDGAGQAEHGHDFAGHGDVEPVLPRCAVGLAAQPVHHEPQLPVVHVHAALPGNLPGIDSQRVPLLDMIVQQRRQQVVRRADRMEVSRKMQVDVLHRHDLGVSAARGSALDPEHRPQARLPQRHGHVLPDPRQPVRQPDRGGRLAFARGGGGHRRHQDQLPRLPVRLIQQRRIDLRLVPPVWLHILLRHMGLLRDLLDRLHPASLRNLNIRKISHHSSPFS